MESYMFTVFQYPTVDIFLCAFQTVTSTDIPVSFWFFTFEDNMSHGEVVGIFHGHSGPFREKDMQIRRDFKSSVQRFVDDAVFLCEYQNIAVGIVTGSFYHFKEVCKVGDITRDMETEETGSAD
jgi:hypothetical protein